MIDFEKIYTSLGEHIVLYGPKLLIAILVLIIGKWIIRMMMRVLERSFSKSKMDATLHSFLIDIISAGLNLILFITFLSMLGIQMSSFVAIIGAAGLAVGLSLQGSLSNFAGGVLIILLKPFKVGDFIEAQGFLGTVSGIQIFNTILKTPDNKTIIIPNGSLSNGNIVNYTTEKKRRVDVVVGISYDDDFRKAKDIIKQLIADDERIMKDPEPFVAVSELGESSVNIVTRVWTDIADFWPVKFDLTENIKLQFDEEDITIPYPQRDVHMYNH
jgi:small conductance mechanosensitive channel